MKLETDSLGDRPSSTMPGSKVTPILVGLPELCTGAASVSGSSEPPSVFVTSAKHELTTAAVNSARVYSPS